MRSPGVQRQTPRAGWVWHVLLLLALSGWLAGVRLSQANLYDPDEPRTAILARLMVEGGDWLAPHLPAVFHHDYPNDPLEEGLVAYWDKPPLYIWLAAGAMKALGPTALAARLPAALSYIATVLLVYAAGRSFWGGRAGLWAGIVMAVAPMPLAMAHAARMDALLVALMAAMLLAILRLVHAMGRAWVWTLVLYGAAGLGLLTKGPEAVVFPAAAVAVTVALTGRWGDLRRLRPAAGALICLAIAAPWYVYMYFRYPPALDGRYAGFLYEFLVRQHFGRAGGELGQHLPPGSLVAALLAGLAPWTVFLPATFARLGRRGWCERRDRPAVLLLAAWAVLVVGVFSLLKTAMLHYVMPAFPPLAILTGAYMADRLSAGDDDRWFRRGLAGAVVFGALATAALPVALVNLGLWQGAYVGAFVALAALVAVAAVLLIRKKQTAATALVTAWTAALATFFLAADPFGVNEHHNTAYAIRAMERSGPRADDAVMAYPHPTYCFTWEMWGRPMLYPTTGGQPWEEPSRDVLVTELNRPRRTFCLLQKHAMVEVLREKVRWPITVLSDEKSYCTFIVVDPGKAAKPHEP